MYNLTRKEKKEIILKKVAEFEITAYEISKKTGLNVGGIEKILNGTVKNPHENTLNSILEYLEKYLLGRKEGSIIHTIAEPKTEYNTQEVSKRLIDCLEETIELRKELSRLKMVLIKNKIEFEENI